MTPTQSQTAHVYCSLHTRSWATHTVCIHYKNRCDSACQDDTDPKMGGQMWSETCFRFQFLQKTKTTWVDHMYNVIYHAKTPVYINSLALNRLQYALSKKWHAFSLIILHDGNPLATLNILNQTWSYNSPLMARLYWKKLIKILLYRQVSFLKQNLLANRQYKLSIALQMK